jgi:hypothetical protein
MKKIFFFTAITFLILSSCRKDVATFSEQQSSNIASISAENSVNAVPINESGTFPVNGSSWNSCTQEFIDFSGTGHVEVHGIISDNKITFILHFNYPNVKGVGRTSGTEYVANSTFNYSNTFNFNTQFVYQQSASTRWIAQGSGLSFTVVNDWHLTVNANGDVTRFISTFGDVITCQ